MAADRIRFVSSSRLDAQPGDPPPALPLLTHLQALGSADWLRASLTTFGTSVASFLPGRFPAYACVYHPFENGGGSPIAASTIIKPAAETFWGGCAGYFQDPEGHQWEVVWNPRFPVRE